MQLPWVTLKGGTRLVKLFLDLCNYSPTAWPRTTNFAVVTLVREGRVSRGSDTPSSYEAGAQCPLNSLDPAEVHRATKFSMVTRLGDGRVSSQSTTHVTHQLTQRDNFVYWDILLELIHHKTTHTSFDQTPVSLLRIGDAGQVDQGGHGSTQLNSTFSLITSVST